MRISHRKLELAMAKAIMTRSELIKSAGVPWSTISRAMSGQGETRPITVGKVAKALGVDPVEIIEMEDCLQR